MIKIEIPAPDVTITKQDYCGPQHKPAMCSQYGFIEYEKIPRRVAGIYNFYNDIGELLYCGQSVSLRSRVREHFYEDTALKNHRDEIYKIDIILVPGALEREILETYIINKLKSKYNVDKVFFRKECLTKSPF